MQSIRRRITYANVMSSIAVFLVLGGATALAAGHLGKNSVGSKQLRKNAVTTVKIKKNAVTTAKIKKGAITGSKVKASTLGTVPSATSAASAGTAGTFAGYSRKGQVRLLATPVASLVEGLASAPQTTLFTAGPFTIYAQCFLQGAEVHGVVSIRTTQNGSIYDSVEGSLVGAPDFLDTTTPPDDREVVAESTTSADYTGNKEEFTAMSPDGTALRGDAQIGVKSGTLPGGDGIYGAGNVCLFAGETVLLNG